ncbi:MAG: polysaccharide biosynthesis protein [Gammaproteobacteria bacterium]
MRILDRRFYIFIHDIAWVPVSILFAFWMRLNLHVLDHATLRSVIELAGIAIPVYAVSFWLFGCYRGIWRFASIPDLLRLMKSVVAGAVVTATLCFILWRLGNTPRSVLILYPILLFGGVTSARLIYRMVRDKTLRLDLDRGPKVLIAGAGKAGEMLVRDLEHTRQFTPVAFVDDAPRKQGHDVRNVRVRGTTDDIPRLIGELAIEMVLVTMPSAPSAVMNKIVMQCAQHGVKCRTLPSLAELADGRVEVSRLRAVTVEDLLGRDPVKLDRQTVAAFIKGKRVLVTGGGGSIGSELCRQIGRLDPGMLIVLDCSEYNIYQIERELSSTHPALVFNALLGSVCDEHNVDALFTQYRPQMVFHAAAYKHVPLVEDNVISGILNNVYGTRTVADAAAKHGVETFVLISTDKTVNPTNVMGTTKRVAELYCQGLSQPGGAHFITTRFGNVLASAGSVVPLFERQIADGGPVTVTHPEITRYFMTIPEAASLILQAGAIGKGGEIFVLDMGEPVRIRDLAEKMILLSGLQPERDIRIEYIGLRPGEKLHEELFYAQEELRRTVHPKVLLASCGSVDMEHIRAGLARLVQSVHANDQERALLELKSLVPEFNPSLTSEERKQRYARPHLQAVK